MSAPGVTIDDIRRAAAAIEGAVIDTPMLLSHTLSKLFGCTLYLKFENLQYTASFKERGALVKLLSLSEAERAAGVVAASAGNHAQGVAYHAQRLGVPAVIVMPQGTPFAKIRQTSAFGAEVVLHGENVGDCAEKAAELSAERGHTIVHPYDDAKVIAGQGTVALEMLAAVPDLDVLVVPVGGGGLISGCATAAKALRPDIEVLGVEAALYPSMIRALRGESGVPGGQTIAEGIAVKRPGRITLAIVRALVDEVVTAGEPALEEAVRLLIEIEKTVAEGAGAAALAAVVEGRERFAGRSVGLVLSGGNIDSRVLATILMRGLVREGRLVQVRCQIADTPGGLAKVAKTIGDRGGNIVEIYHQRLFQDVPVVIAQLDVVLETRDAEHAQAIVDALNEGGFKTSMLRYDHGA